MKSGEPERRSSSSLVSARPHLGRRMLVGDVVIEVVFGRRVALLVGGRAELVELVARLGGRRLRLDVGLPGRARQRHVGLARVALEVEDSAGGTRGAGRLERLGRGRALVLDLIARGARGRGAPRSRDEPARGRGRAAPSRPRAEAAEDRGRRRARAASSASRLGLGLGTSRPRPRTRLGRLGRLDRRPHLGLGAGASASGGGLGARARSSAIRSARDSAGGRSSAAGASGSASGADGGAGRRGWRLGGAAAPRRGPRKDAAARARRRATSAGPCGERLGVDGPRRAGGGSARGGGGAPGRGRGRLGTRRGASAPRCRCRPGQRAAAVAGPGISSEPGSPGPGAADLAEQVAGAEGVGPIARPEGRRPRGCAPLPPGRRAGASGRGGRELRRRECPSCAVPRR